MVASFWEVVSEALALNPEAYRAVEAMPFGGRSALLVVLLAGFSEAIAQGIVLFINQVKPLRFILSLVIAAILFVFGFLFWAGSTWLVATAIFRQFTPWDRLIRTLGLSFAPKLFSCFIALPYLGVPISFGLSVWSFLAFIVGIRANLNVSFSTAFWYSILGWVVFQILQNTIGRPIGAIGRWLKNTTAGMTLITDLKELEQSIQQGRQR